MEMTILQAVLCGVVYWLAVGNLPFVGLWSLQRPLVCGAITGLILGHPVQGAVIGATINLVYLGFMSAGGSMPADMGLAGVLGTAYAIVGGLDTDTALALAVPIGILGTIVWAGRMTFDCFFVHMADKAAENADFSGIDKALWGGAILFFVSYFLLVFLGAFLGSSVIGAFVKMIPQFVTDGLNAASGMLPALGIAILMQLLFDKKNAAFFFIGWAMTALFSVNTVGAAVVGTAIAYTIYQYTISNKNHNNSVDMISDDLGGEL